MTARILLTGGTGTLGRLVAPLLHEAGCQVRVLSRRGHQSTAGIDFVLGDLATGDGVEAAVAGVDTILHCAGSARGDEDKARNLVRAASKVGAPHVVYISVVGAHRVPVVSSMDRALFGYYAAKRAAERVVEDSRLPWTSLRATQFHDLVLVLMTQLAKLPVMPVFAGFRFQPVDAGEVATRLAELALGEPSGLAPDLAGPRAYGMDELARSYLVASHRHRLVVPVMVPGGAARAIRAGANLAPDRPVGRRTWEDFLAERLPLATHSPRR